MNRYGRKRGHGNKPYQRNNQHMTFDQLLDKACVDSKKIEKEKEEINNLYEEYYQDKNVKNNNPHYNKKGNQIYNKPEKEYNNQNNHEKKFTIKNNNDNYNYNYNKNYNNLCRKANKSKEK